MKKQKIDIKKTIKKRIEYRHNKNNYIEKRNIEVNDRTKLRIFGEKNKNNILIKNINTSLSKAEKNELRISNLNELSLSYDRYDNKLIGVLIINLNNIDLTKSCIDSLNKQINQNFKIYLVDQNSSEKGTTDFLNDCKNNNIIVINNNNNVPVNYVWNEFKNICDCEYLCYLNNDVVLSNTFIDDTIKILDNEPTVGAVIHVTNNPKYLQAKNNIDYKIFEKPQYQGWDYTIRRSIMPEIPKSLLIFGGDDYIFAKICSKGHKISIAFSSPIIHYKEKTRIVISNINEIQRNDAQSFFNLLRIEGLKQISSTMDDICLRYPQKNMKITQNKNCVFTAAIGSYDNILPTEYEKSSNWDYICFTDNKNIKSDFWRIIYIYNDSTDHLKNIKLARYFKTKFFKYLSSYENLIWIDARITITNNINEYLENLKNNDIVFLKHPDALNILEEFNRVLKGNIEKPEMINKIKKRYQEFGYKYDNGLISSGVMLFKNNEKIIKFFNDWWYEINNYSHRDQLSANFALWRNPEIKYVMLRGILNNKYFKQLPRRTKPFRYE